MARRQYDLRIVVMDLMTKVVEDLQDIYRTEMFELTHELDGPRRPKTGAFHHDQVRSA